VPSLTPAAGPGGWPGGDHRAVFAPRSECFRGV